MLWVVGAFIPVVLPIPAQLGYVLIAVLVGARLGLLHPRPPLARLDGQPAGVGAVGPAAAGARSLRCRVPACRPPRRPARSRPPPGGDRRDRSTGRSGDGRAAAPELSAGSRPDAGPDPLRHPPPARPDGAARPPCSPCWRAAPSTPADGPAAGRTPRRDPPRRRPRRPGRAEPPRPLRPRPRRARQQRRGSCRGGWPSGPGSTSRASRSPWSTTAAPAPGRPGRLRRWFPDADAGRLRALAPARRRGGRRRPAAVQPRLAHRAAAGADPDLRAAGDRGPGRRPRVDLDAPRRPRPSDRSRRGRPSSLELEAGQPQAGGVDLGRGGQRLLGLPEPVEARLAGPLDDAVDEGDPTVEVAWPSSRPSSRSTKRSASPASTRSRRTASASRPPARARGRRPRP